MSGALRNEAKHPVRCHRIIIGWHLESTHVKRKREPQPGDPYPKSPATGILTVYNNTELTDDVFGRPL
jgi:hypothetical protein